ncbi:MAG: hypothetical protein K5930_00530 [Treponemataceae bacterium]|nr:hypothetical protein [Treponemataceae bacterium]
MKKFFIGSIAVIVVFAAIFGCILKFQQREIALLEDQIKYLEEEFVPMKFEVQERKDSNIAVKIKYYDMLGDEVGSSNIKVKGDELNFDFQVIQFSDKAFIFFPCGVYTDQMALIDEISVCGDYDYKGFPQIYNGMQFFDKDSKPLDEEGVLQIKEQFSTYYAIASKGELASRTEQHGVAVHDLKSVSEFKKGFVYKVVCHPHSGGIEIVKMK